MKMQKFIPVLLAFIFLNSSHAVAQYISTIAGNGTMGHTGDSGPAVLAELYLPNSVAVDSRGNVYIAESSGYVRKITPEGTIHNYAGNGTLSVVDGGPATATGIWPIGMAVDKYDNLFVADVYYRIRKIDTFGIITTIAGNGISGDSGDGGPATTAKIRGSDYVAVDTSGNVYITDAIDQCVRKIDISGTITRIAGTGIAGYSGDGGHATAAQFYIPHSISTDFIGNIYIVDDSNFCIRKIDATGIVSTFAGTGIAGFSGDGGSATSAQVNEMDGIMNDQQGTLYICDDRGNNRIRKVSPSGIITTILGGDLLLGFGGDGGPATAASVNRPFFCARHANGNIYLTDRQNNRIRMISAKPFFSHGDIQADNICNNAVSLDSLLSAIDSNTGIPIYWAAVSGPFHGIASVAYTATSTGSLLTPTGLTYTPTPGYTGTDTITVSITDSVISDTTIIYLTVSGPANAGTITGADTVCAGSGTTLTDTATGGSWNCSNTHALAFGNVITGITPGTDTIIYSVTNVCGTVIADHVVQVKDCTNGINNVNEVNNIRIYPNPCKGSFILYPEAAIDEQVHVAISNIAGETVSEFGMWTNRERIVYIDAPAGFYFVSISAPAQTTVSTINVAH